MNARIPPSLAGRTVRPGGGVAVEPRDGQIVRTTSRPARRKSRVPAIIRSSTRHFLRKVAFGVVVSVIVSALSGAFTYIIDTIWRFF
ncbi:hypothetical protein GCM10029978_029990 [Actinoallomurus acanthiterrae]